MKEKPILVVTAGDPCGIGPEVVLKALAISRIPSRFQLVIIGDSRVFKKAALSLRRPLPAWRRQGPDDPWRPSGQSAPILIDMAHPKMFEPGGASAASGEASLSYLRCAMQLWREHGLEALVTAPVTKWAIDRTGISFSGQTEFLARETKTSHVVMMFVSEGTRVALLTRHLALRAVSAAVTCGLFRSSLQMVVRVLKKQFGIAHPRIAVCGLNPHAGESGLFGREEKTVLLPVMRSMRRKGIVCDGPFAADGFFAKEPILAGGRMRRRRGYDAIVCCYHDQGLIPFKMMARDSGCQLSAGLPFVRTSPDHGSAIDIAGKALADPGSMRYAIELAARLVLRSTKIAPGSPAHGRGRMARF